MLDRLESLSRDTCKPIGIIKNSLFLMSNLLRGKPHPQNEKVNFI